MKTLVVYYSRSGTTKNVAETIARRLRAEIEELVPIKGYAGFFGFLRGGFQASFKATPVIRDLKTDPSAFELLVIGTPVWASKIAPPVRTFIKNHKSKFKKVACFCTSGSVAGSLKDGNALVEMAEYCGIKPVATAGFQQKMAAEKNFAQKLDEFLKEISR